MSSWGTAVSIKLSGACTTLSVSLSFTSLVKVGVKKSSKSLYWSFISVGMKCFL